MKVALVAPAIGLAVLPLVPLYHWYVYRPPTAGVAVKVAAWPEFTPGGLTVTEAGCTSSSCHLAATPGESAASWLRLPSAVLNESACRKLSATYQATSEVYVGGRRIECLIGKEVAPEDYQQPILTPDRMFENVERVSQAAPQAACRAGVNYDTVLGIPPILLVNCPGMTDSGSFAEITDPSVEE